MNFNDQTALWHRGAVFSCPKGGAVMTEKLKEFADLYIANDFNATDAAFATGRYRDKNTAKAAGSRLLKKKEVQDYIRQRTEERRVETGVIASIDDVLKFYSDVMDGRAVRKKIVVMNNDFVETDEHPTFTDSLRAADGLAKAYGLVKGETKIDVGDKTLKAITDLSMKEKKAILEDAAKDFR
jgi:phage terminase small subunit